MKWIILVFFLAGSPLYAVEWGGNKYQKEIKERDGRMVDWDAVDAERTIHISQESGSAPRNRFVYLSYQNIVWIVTWGKVNL